ncbi:male sterility protein-domain-containing protein [Gautieria morchelliformis]|nr:male sterility protein-domain-containing protein [Gautieria morchelliformis]
MAGPNFKAYSLLDKPFPDLFTLTAKANPDRDLVQIIQEQPDAPVDAIRYTWGQTLQHAQNSAVDIRARWVSCLKDAGAEQSAPPLREPGSAPIVVGILANTSGCLAVSPTSPSAAKWNGIYLVSRPYVWPLSIRWGVMLLHLLSPLSPLNSSRRRWTRPPFSCTRLGLLVCDSTLHSGHPKIIPWTHDFMLGPARHLVGLPFYCVAPLSHALTLFPCVQIVLVDGYLITFVASPTPKPPTAQALLRHLPFIKGGVVNVPPSILEDLHGLGPAAVKAAADALKYVGYAGAPLKKEIGDSLVAAGIKLHIGAGATETSAVSKFIPREHCRDWQYADCSDLYNIIWLPVDGDTNLKHMLVAPSSIGSPAVINHENPRGYATNDLWEPHPSVPNLWRFHSRMGNVTVLSNGEKTDNKQIEELLLADKRILYVQIFGAGRPMNGIVLQPRDNSISASDFLSQIQPTIEHTNTIIPKHSRLVRELIIVAPSDKPFALTDKSTVRKKETLDRFQVEIEAAYKILDEGGNGDDWAFEGSVTDENDLKKFVRSAINQVLGEGVADDEDLFEHGFDSLLSIKKTVTTTKPTPRNVVYTSPSVNALTAYLLSRSVPDTSDVLSATSERIRSTIAKYSSNFSRHQPGSTLVEGKVIALTGSTGSAGSSILALLLDRSDVKKIYLLNRKGNERQDLRQAKGFEERGLNPTKLEAKKGSLIYLDIDLARSDLGLEGADHTDLRDNVTHIIHAAWHLNFNLILESYERVHIAGVRHLIDLALASPHARPPRLTFLSTVAAAARYQGPSREPSVGESAGHVLVPEEPIDDPSIPLHQGYGQGKYVIERILVNGVDAGLRTTIVRVGQLSGMTTNGAWSSSEHVPILFKSSVALGMVPVDLPPVRWVPTDIAASVIIKEAFQDDTPLQYFAVENPTPTPWSTIVSALSSESPKPLQHVSMAAWVEYIQKSNPDPETVPAVRLLEFYQGMTGGEHSPSILGWEKSIRVAPELAVGKLDADLVAKYVKWQLN